MSSPSPDRRAVEDLWRQRLNDAKLRLDFARNYVKEVKQEFLSPGIPAPDGNFAYREAVRMETLALWKYNHTLHVYWQLTTNGIVPDEAEWLKAQAASADGSDPGSQ